MSDEQADAAAAAEEVAEDADERAGDEDIVEEIGEEETDDEEIVEEELDEGETDDGEAAGDEAAGDEALVERLADSEPEEIADEIASLRERIGELERRLEETETERDDLESRLKRKQAEFENYKKRQQKRREEERARATEDLVERLLDVRDNLRRAVDAEADADIREGVEATSRQLGDIFETEGVEIIEPDPGSEVDPQRHEVLLRVESDRPAGTIADVHRPGYEMGGKVLRAAQVTVSE